MRTICCAARRESPPAASASPASSSHRAGIREPGDLRGERAHGERELSGGEHRHRTVIVAELFTDPDQLDRADHMAAGAGGKRHQPHRASLLGDPAGRLGGLAGDDGLAEPARAGHLGAE